MKLVDILARELKEFPHGDSPLVQGSFGQVYICGGGPIIIQTSRAEDWELAEVTRAQWQAAVDALKAEKVVEPSEINKKLIRSNDDLAVLVASKTFYRFGNLFWGEGIRRKDLVGKLAGSVSATDGYRYVKCGKARNRVAAHRVIFLMHHGYLPEVIDHINRIRDDNRIENLRDAGTEGNNQANQTHQTGRSSQYKGVCWDAARGKWSAYVKQAGQRWNLGRFSSEEQAASAYNAKAIELFGEFANLNEIRTPDQIAAEARSKACDAIYGVLTGPTVERKGNTSDMAEALYDAGYRKFEIVEGE